MTGPYRVAVYAAPGSGPDPYGAELLERAETWLGRATDGHPVVAGAPDGWNRDEVDAITVNARRYGFHGTFQAPFRLADGHSLAELDEVVAGLAAAHADVLIPRLALTRLGNFYALTPGAEAVPLYSLADDIVRGLDSLRAPLTDAEITRRRPDRLTDRQRQLLNRWGYPYVFDEFRFHLTVTDSIDPQRQEAVEVVARDWFADSLGRDIAVDVLAVFVESEAGAPFALHSTHPLRPHPIQQPPNQARPISRRDTRPAPARLREEAR